MWKKSSPKAMDELKQELWENVYSKVPALPKNIVTKDNYYVLQGAKDSTKIHPMMIEKLIDFFEADPKRFDELYGVMNKT